MFKRIVYSGTLKQTIYSTEQHGFRPGKSTGFAGVSFKQNIVNSIDNGEKAVGVFLDLSCAFYSVSHSILIIDYNVYVFKGKNLHGFLPICTIDNRI